MPYNCIQPRQSYGRHSSAFNGYIFQRHEILVTWSPKPQLGVMDASGFTIEMSMLHDYMDACLIYFFASPEWVLCSSPQATLLSNTWAHTIHPIPLAKLTYSTCLESLDYLYCNDLERNHQTFASNIINSNHYIIKNDNCLLPVLQMPPSYCK